MEDPQDQVRTDETQAVAGIDLPDVEAMARQCLGLSVRRTSNLITRHYNGYLAASGLEVTQFSLLAGIASGRPTSLGDLAAILSIDRSTLTRNLKPLQVAGLVALQPAPGRRQLPGLTPEGAAVLRQAASDWQRAQSSLVSALGPDATANVRAALKTLRDALRLSGSGQPASRP